MTILQSGSVTPSHLAAWTTDGVIQDSGVTFSNTYGVFASTVENINFNSANTDNPIPINLPIGYTRWRVQSIVLSGATTSLSTATCGVFTTQNAGGIAIVSSGSAITVTQTALDTNNNLQTFTINNAPTLAYSDTVIFFRVQNAQGSPAFGNVTVFYFPLP